MCLRSCSSGTRQWANRRSSQRWRQLQRRLGTGPRAVIESVGRRRAPPADSTSYIAVTAHPHRGGRTFRHMRTLALIALLASFALMAPAPVAEAQDGDRLISARVHHVIVPQSRSFRLRARLRARPHHRRQGAGAAARAHRAHDAGDQSVHNPNRRQTEAVLLLPVPDRAAVSAFAYDGPATEPTAKDPAQARGARASTTRSCGARATRRCWSSPATTSCVPASSPSPPAAARRSASPTPILPRPTASASITSCLARSRWT